MSRLADGIENLQFGMVNPTRKVIDPRKMQLAQKTPKLVEGLRIFVSYRPELQSNLTEFLLTLPIDKIGIWAVGGWEECIPKASEAKAKLNEFIRKVQEQTKDPFVKTAATNALR